MNPSRLAGLIAATVTPLGQDGNVDLDQIGPMTERLITSGVNGVYVCGSTGEGMSLSTAERKRVTETFVSAVAGRVPVIVQVGHNSIAEARALATHAASAGVDILSATCPSYFKVATVDKLIESMAEIAKGAPDLPFYYYHIPALTGSQIDIVDFLRRGGDQIKNLAGLKYTTTLLHEFQRCCSVDDGRYDVVWGCDEMLLGALATGTNAAIGSTYNIAAPLYQQIIDAFTQGNLEQARQLQLQSVAMIEAMAKNAFHPALKAVMEMLGMACGPCRLPLGELTTQQTNDLRQDLESIGFFDWCGHKS